jgi:hypothetical protein
MSKTRITTTVLGAATLAAGALMLGTPTASADPQANQEWFSDYGLLGQPSVQPGEYVGHIHTANAPNKCLEAYGPDFFLTAPTVPNGAEVDIYDCINNAFVNTSNQTWFQYNQGDGSWSYYLKYRNTWGQHYCLDAPQGQDWNGAPMQIWACPNPGDPTNTNQHWTIGPAGQLQSVSDPGLCLDDTNWNTDNGTQMQVWACSY